MSIDKQLKPELVKFFESFSVVMPGKKCMSLGSCPIWLRSYDALWPDSSIIGEKVFRLAEEIAGCIDIEL